jgi:hypothetical protein
MCRTFTRHCEVGKKPIKAVDRHCKEKKKKKKKKKRYNKSSKRGKEDEWQERRALMERVRTLDCLRYEEGTSMISIHCFPYIDRCCYTGFKHVPYAPKVDYLSCKKNEQEREKAATLPAINRDEQ